MTGESEAPGQTETNEGKRNLWIVALVILILTCVSMAPLLYGLSLSDGRVFTWSPTNNTFDYSYYLSYMRQGYDGLWQVENLSTTDKQTADVIHLFYVASGHAARLLNLPIPITYQVSRLLVGAGFVFLIWGYLSKYIGERARLMALLFVFFSSGLGWLPLLQSNDSIDLWFADATTFTTFYFWPHMLWSLALKTAAVICLYVGLETRKARFGLIGGLCCGLLTFDHTFDLYGIAMFCVVYAIVRLCADRLKGKPMELGAWAVQLGAMALAALPFTVFMLRQFQNNPLMQYRSTINVEIVPPIEAVISGYGLVGLLALVPLVTSMPNVRSTWHRNLEEMVSYKTLLFLYVWATVNLGSMYLFASTWFGRRLILGAHVPLAILAAIGVAIILNRLGARASRPQLTALGCLIVMLSSISNLMIIQSQIKGYQSGIGRAIDGVCRLYLQPFEVDRLRSIGAQTSPETIVQPLPTVTNGVADLTLVYFGPWLTARHQVCSHPFETPHAPQRLHNLEKIAEQQQGVFVGDSRGGQVVPLQP